MKDVLGNGDESKSSRSYPAAAYWILGAAVFLIFAIWLEDNRGISFGFSLRIVIIACCQWLLWGLKNDYPGARWPRTVFWLALLMNAVVLISPLTDRPPARGEPMLFALPDAVLLLAVRTATYKVADAHQRAVRQQLVVGLVLALALYGIFLTVMLLGGKLDDWGLHWHAANVS